MEFRNDTPYAAKLARAQLLYKDLLLATVVVKSSFAVAKDGKVHRIPEQPEPSEEDVTTELGAVEGDMAPIKAGCDVAVLGVARSQPPGMLVSSLEVSLKLGTWMRRVVVTGDRKWISSDGCLVPSAPLQFHTMPLTYERAYGGAARVNGELDVQHPENPLGRGFIALAETALGTALPNVEEADQPLTSWQQRSLPASLAPLPRVSALRGMRGVTVDLEAQTTALAAEAFCFGHPRMQLAAYPGRQMLELAGMHRDGVWKFELPEVPTYAQIELGEWRYELPLQTDTLCLFPEEDRFFVLSRLAFIYQFRPERRRCLRVTDVALTSASAVHSNIAAQRCAPEAQVPIEPETPDAESPLPFQLMLDMNPLTKILERLPLCASG